MLRVPKIQEKRRLFLGKINLLRKLNLNKINKTNKNKTGMPILIELLVLNEIKNKRFNRKLYGNF